MTKLKKDFKVKNRKSTGALILSKKTGRFLFGLRSELETYPLTWGIFGGKLLSKESNLEGLERELREEIKEIPNIIQIIPVDLYINKEKFFEYFSFLIIVEDEFIPKLNKEHVGYCWVELDKWKTIKLHPSVKKTLNNNLLIKSFKKIIKDFKK